MNLLVDVGRCARLASGVCEACALRTRGGSGASTVSRAAPCVLPYVILLTQRSGADVDMQPVSLYEIDCSNAVAK